MLKNTASQTICFQGISATDGDAVTTGTPTVYVLGDGGTMSTGGGTKTHEGQGVYSYVPTQAETNYDHVSYTMVLSGAINHTINVYPSTFDYTTSTQTTIANATADAVWDESQSAHTTAGSFGEIATEIADILEDTGTTLPATLTTIDNEIATIDSNVDLVLEDTGTTLPTQITNLNDITAADAADAVWDEATTGHTNSGSFGRQVKDTIDGINTHVATDIPADIAALNDPTAAAIADAVWDEVQSGHTTVGTFGYYLDAQVSGAANPPSAADIADAVWEESQADHVAAGSFGVVATEVADILTDTDTTIPGLISGLNDPTAAAVADAVWDEATAGHTTAGTFGEQVKTDIDAILTDTETTIPAQISALVIPSSTTIAGAVWDKATASHTGAGTFGEQCGTDIDAILADTDELQTDDIPATLAALNDISVDDIWSEPQAGYTTAGTFGDNLDQTVSTAGGGGLTAGGIADAVWDEAMSGHTTTGTAGAVFDSTSDLIKTDVLEINSVSNAASQLSKSAGQIISGTVDTGTNSHTPTTIVFQADDITEATSNHYNDRSLIFTSGALAGQATEITGYSVVGGIGQFTVTTMTEAPANDDTFIIV